MSTELLKIAFMRGVQMADREVGITLDDHMRGLTKHARIGWGALALPALGAGLGAAASPGREEQGIAAGALMGLGTYGAGKLLLSPFARMFGRRAAAAAPAAKETVKQTVQQVAKAPAQGVAQEAAKKTMSPWKAGLIGGGVGIGGGMLAHKAMSPSVSSEEQQLLDEYRMQQAQQLQQAQAAQAQQMGLLM